MEVFNFVSLQDKHELIHRWISSKVPLSARKKSDKAVHKIIQIVLLNKLLLWNQEFETRHNNVEILHIYLWGLFLNLEITFSVFESWSSWTRRKCNCLNWIKNIIMVTLYYTILNFIWQGTIEYETTLFILFIYVRYIREVNIYFNLFNCLILFSFTFDSLLFNWYIH